MAARVEQLEAARDPAVAPVAPTAAGGAVGRRQLLGRGAAAAGAAVVAGTAAALGAASPAAADNGQALVLGSDVNTATEATGLSFQGPTGQYGIGVTDNGASFLAEFAAIWGHAKGQSFEVGVLGQATNGKTGVVGLTEGEGGVGVYGGGRVGLMADGLTGLYIRPTGGPAPPDWVDAGKTGQFRWGAKGLWVCIADGTPGTWRRVVGTGTAGAFHLLPSPVRVYDSRPGTNPAQGPKTKLPAGNVARTIDLKHNTSGVPAGATGVLLTVLLVNATTGNGNMTVWANDKPKPLSNTMVWGGNLGRFTATTTTAVDPTAQVKVDASLTTDLVLDVVGYYR